MQLGCLGVVNLRNHRCGLVMLMSVCRCLVEFLYMCFCGDPCKVDVSVEEDTYRQRYWMCANYAFDPTPRQIRIGLLVRIYV